VRRARQGTVYWFTGLSGSGKTTLGHGFFLRLRKRNPFSVWLDGDILREVFGNDLGHTLRDRRVSAMRNARLCRFLSSQGLDVVCATISMFHACRQWNRRHIPRYREIYLKVPLDVLRRRDVKGIYRGWKSGRIKHVVGGDLAFEEPRRPDVVVPNDGRLKPGEIVRRLCRRFHVT
jgi:cytidine diphosphoramidate kinase